MNTVQVQERAVWILKIVMCVCICLCESICVERNLQKKLRK